MGTKKHYKAYINDDCVPADDRKYCVEIYEVDENGDYVQTVDYEYYSTLSEAEQRVKEINEGAIGG